ncbi:hypothetical protein EMIHUDRAFT_198071 [Emiliania huxleyi CCMP1516]|uniref:Uncharacterized protein n=2 Tax=Emiliania huxleyi TaxID=2903 RepID=A0A0D3IE82_EMIH1|nr:hypothetical protein EMIHUDRAFT_198071 [Emiliania huxleyi CCMP1516]EOD09567.1 hypothetical protein EMIHUDRAFT_198071 [Emiliania huxleyi CCMP1516]|eukprot:XP_005761996.1 hypothetical protein EMIHUDRAFT_198071 [Emiliania huxleyi CCMP1516]
MVWVVAYLPGDPTTTYKGNHSDGSSQATTECYTDIADESSHERCYVDPAACNTEYSTAAYVVGATLHSSYRACGFSNEFES